MRTFYENSGSQRGYQEPIDFKAEPDVLGVTLDGQADAIQLAQLLGVYADSRIGGNKKYTLDLFQYSQFSDAELAAEALRIQAGVMRQAAEIDDETGENLFSITCRAAPITQRVMGATVKLTPSDVNAVAGRTPIKISETSLFSKRLYYGLGAQGNPYGKDWGGRDTMLEVEGGHGRDPYIYNRYPEVRLRLDRIGDTGVDDNPLAPNTEVPQVPESDS